MLPILFEVSVHNGQAYGEIYGDERFPDGTIVTTSTVLSQTDETIHTLNTLYHRATSEQEDVITQHQYVMERVNELRHPSDDLLIKQLDALHAYRRILEERIRTWK